MSSAHSLSQIKPIFKNYMQFVGVVILAFCFGLNVCEAKENKNIKLEYIAHASFRIHSPSGHKIIIDPYADHYWLGYNFPKGLEANAIFITHAHFDHDGGISLGREFPFPPSVPIYRDPVKVKIGDLTATGISYVHSGTGKDGKKLSNTLWIFEYSGIRIVHLGDNEPLTLKKIRELGRIDVLLIRRSGPDDSIYKTEIDIIKKEMNPKIIIPMHYRHPDLELNENSPKGLNEIESWLVDQSDVKYQTSHQISLNKKSLPNKTEIWVLPHAPYVTN